MASAFSRKHASPWAFVESSFRCGDGAVDIGGTAVGHACPNCAGSWVLTLEICTICRFVPAVVDEISKGLDFTHYQAAPCTSSLSHNGGFPAIMSAAFSAMATTVA